MNYTDKQGNKRDSNSSPNQRIKDKFVSIHIRAHVSQMVSYILKNEDDGSAPFSYDDCDNIDEYENSKTYEVLNSEKEVEQEIERLKDLLPTEEAKEAVGSEIEGWEKHYMNFKEVYEWYIVDGFLLDKLEKSGQVVIESENIWGRCTTGQQISIDSIIDNICIEMGILEGLEYQWTTI